LATILSTAMMLQYSFQLTREAKAVEDAVEKVLAQGLKTADLAKGGPSVSCREMGEAVCAGIC
jgi:3-isopropylmalate dehydrogenase